LILIPMAAREKTGARNLGKAPAQAIHLQNQGKTRGGIKKEPKIATVSIHR